MTSTVEKRTRLPIALLVASGYFLGLMLPISRLVWVRKLGYWGIVLPFALLFYAGRDRLLDLLRETNYGQPVELTREDEWYERLLKVASLCAAILVCGLLGLAAWYFANDYLHWNLYLSIGLGIFVFWGVLGLVVDGDGTDDPS